MNRIDVIYDGHPRSLTGTPVDELTARILATATGAEPFWLTVNEGAGTRKAVDLLITSTSQISLAEIQKETQD